MSKHRYVYKVWKNGVRTEMAYSDICHDLDFDPESGFIRVTTAGTITFTCGKPYEVNALYQVVVERGYKPSYALTYVSKHR